MTKEEFLKNLAIKGYDVGFGAKKNFSSFDIITKLPSWVGFISFSIGVVQLAYPDLPCQKPLAIILIISSMAIMYIESFKSDIKNYETEGRRLTVIFNQLRELYLIVKSDTNFDYQAYKSKYDNLMNDFYSFSISKQVFLSQWFAHYKLFYEHQIDWLDEQHNFKFFKDKVPGSFKATIIILILIAFIILAVYGYCHYI